LQALLLEHLHLLIKSSSIKCPFIQLSVQFPKSKYIGPESLQVKQLLLSADAD
jgi:hypothetical protein